MCMSVNASLQRNSIYQRFFRNALNLEERTKKENGFRNSNQWQTNFE